MTRACACASSESTCSQPPPTVYTKDQLLETNLSVNHQNPSGLMKHGYVSFFSFPAVSVDAIDE